MNNTNASLKTFLPILFGFLTLYIPTYYHLVNQIWAKEEHAHSPIIFLIILYLFWRNRHAVFNIDGHPWVVGGSLILFVGLLFYVSGRALDILIFEVGSQVPVLLGVLLITSGTTAVKALWLPIMFLLFIIPLPGFLVDLLTNPLKHQVSVVVDQILHISGYPIGRSGVVLTIGPYQMLIADACSGLNSMFSLSALGLLYTYIKPYKDKVITLMLLGSILPIAFFVNILRVMVLVLVTYHYGDEVGQGFLHNFAGITEVAFAMVLFFSVDSMLLFMYQKYKRYLRVQGV